MGEQPYTTQWSRFIPSFTPIFPHIFMSKTSTTADVSTKPKAAAAASKSDAKAESKPDARGDAIEAALSQIKKRYGDGAIMEMGNVTTSQIERFS